MSKQLVMENYVDECLDEVEIRGLFIQEGAAMSPRDNIIKSLTDQLWGFQDDLRDADSGYEKVRIKKIIDSIQTSIKRAKIEKGGLFHDTPEIYQLVGITLIVAAVAYGSYKLYKRFIAKAARVCQDKKGKVKSICMNQYQIKGLEASKKPLMNGMTKCSNSKNTPKCKAKFKDKIDIINSKIKKKQNKIKKLMSKNRK